MGCRRVEPEYGRALGSLARLGFERVVLWRGPSPHEPLGLARRARVVQVRVELLYEPDTRGHSGAFHLKVVDEGAGG